MASARAALAALIIGAFVFLRSPGPSDAFVSGAPAGVRGVSLQQQLALRGAMASSRGHLSRVALAATSTMEKPAGIMDMDLTGKVVLVTGASRGIGEAIANKLAAAGATVVGTATSDGGAETIAGRFTGDLKGTGMKLDVSDGSDVDAVLKAIEKEYGGVDILINNAGITKDTLMMRMKDSDWEDVINTNLNSIYRVTKAVLKGMMKKRWGRVISISSVVASLGNAGQSNYAAAKAGMEGFSRSMAREVASRGITLNCVAPGFIESDMTAGLKEEWKEALFKQIPAGRMGTPEEIADAVLFLASPSSAYITGSVIHVNGGMYM